MSKSIRSFLSFLLVLQLIIPYSTFAAAVGEFSSVVGDVTQTRAKEVITPVVKSPVEMKDLIVTSRSASATMIFSDDSTIRLSENTKLEIREFLFKDKSRTAFFSLATGKLQANVKKHIGGDNVFQVHSPTVVVGVRGTGFDFEEAVTPEKLGKATISCTEGSLNLWALSAAGDVVSSAVLVAGQVAVIIGGVITISAIGSATATTRSAEAVAADTAGGAGAGTGGAAATAAGLSTGAKIGIAAGAVALIGVTAAAIGGGGGGGSSSSSGGGSTPTPGNCSTAVGNWAGTSTGTLVDNIGRTFLLTGTWTMTVNTDCTGSFSSSSAGQGARQSYTLAVAVDGGRVSCANCVSGNTITGIITNNSYTGTAIIGQSQESFTGSRI